MASQKQISGFIFTSLIVLVWLTCQADPAYGSNVGVFPSATVSEDNYKVKLSVYYESLCPYCANFIVNQLAKIFQTDLINIVNLRLVPWGNTQISPNNTWICQHGVDECRLDAMEACAINAWPRVDMHFKFVHCVERLNLMNRQTEWQSCFGATGLDPNPLQNCYNNGLAYRLEKAYADETANLKPKHRFVPWVVVDDLPLQDDYPNFVAYICQAYKGYKIPKACPLKRSVATDCWVGGPLFANKTCSIAPNFLDKCRAPCLGGIRSAYWVRAVQFTCGVFVE